MDWISPSPPNAFTKGGKLLNYDPDASGFGQQSRQRHDTTTELHYLSRQRPVRSGVVSQVRASNGFMIHGLFPSAYHPVLPASTLFAVSSEFLMCPSCVCPSLLIFSSGPFPLRSLSFVTVILSASRSSVSAHTHILVPDHEFLIPRKDPAVLLTFQFFMILIGFPALLLALLFSVDVLFPGVPASPLTFLPPWTSSWHQREDAAGRETQGLIIFGLFFVTSASMLTAPCPREPSLQAIIEDAALRAEETTDEQQRRKYVERDSNPSKERSPKLFITLPAYLDATPPDTVRYMETFESFGHHPVFQTFEQEIFTDGFHALRPLERVDVSQGLALSDEVKQVVTNRSGSVLSASTIMKSDFFSNLQKLSLPDFRRLPLTLRLAGAATMETLPTDVIVQDSKQVCGTGIPTIQGLKFALSRVGADANGANMVAWTSLHPPGSLLLWPTCLKEDLLREVRSKHGKLLLHDEPETESGTFEIVPQWEQLAEEDILTTKEVFELVAREGFNVRELAQVGYNKDNLMTSPHAGRLRQNLDRVYQP
ncbi:hypothetical protein JB92DRAFT_2838806 [Gautieria morchelliformis]|nr:hypothetical protein JB92DRAFT_2838806 [Gautieria morchelliformis]